VKRKHTDDRRVRLVELTANGRALITKTFRKHAAAMEEAAATSAAPLPRPPEWGVETPDESPPLLHPAGRAQNG